MVGPAVSLDTLAEMADLVVKAKVISNAEVNDATFRSIPGFAPFATKLQIISVLKGDPGSDLITFRHYGTHPETNRRVTTNFEPQHYEFTEGKSYIIFAKKGVSNGSFTQLWMNHTTKNDQGVFRAGNDAPLTTASIKEACWSTLVDMQDSTNTEDIAYAPDQMDQMSLGHLVPFGGLDDFSRKDVIELIRPHLASRDPEVLEASIKAANSHNLLERDPVVWLASAGKGHLPGYRSGPRLDNLSGRLLWRELSALAGTNQPTNIRCMAIKALAGAGVAELQPLSKQWAHDSEPRVRQTAVELISEFPGSDTEEVIKNAATDRDSEVRKGAALAIGFGQIRPLIPTLEKLFEEETPEVRDAAAMSLLSFSITASGDVLRKHLNDPEYHGLFVNALATADPGPYLARLRENIVSNPEPKNFWGGKMPSADSWDILFKYVQSRSQQELRSGVLDSSMDALEKPSWFSSSEPRDLYALYLQRGLTVRAKAFREKCKHTVPFDMEYYFSMVDQSPGAYQRDK